MIKNSLHRKIVALLLAALGVCQVATLGFVLLAAHNSARESVERDLVTAEEVFQRLFDQRYLQLLESVDVLASDFGFKRAAASGDGPTIVSALGNHSARAGAAVAVLLGVGGDVHLSAPAHAALVQSSAWSDLVGEVQRDDAAARTLPVANAAYQMVAVPVVAPDKIAWLFMGFSVDNALANEFKRLTGRDVSFFTAGATPRVLASTVNGGQWNVLARAVGEIAGSAATHEVRLDDGDYLTRTHPLDLERSRVAAVLQESLTEALAPYHTLATRLAALFVVTLLLAAVGAVLLVSGITRPLRALVDAATRIGEGNYATDIEIKSDDEIGQLAATLDSMQFEISEREHRIMHQAHHDDLTGLPNRWLALDRLNGAINRARRSGTGFTVAQIDLSRFKHINDTFGHHVGDIVLKETARRISDRLRASDTVARLGGDDFFLILEGTGLEAGIGFIDKLRATLTAPVELDDMTVSFDFRVGCAAFPDHAEDAAALIRRSEIALYDAKDTLQRVVAYENGRDDGNRRQLAIVSDLDAALERGDLSLHYQPKVDFADGGVRQAEALIRWIHPEFGFIPPDEFIGVLEESGNIQKLTRWVINRAASQGRLWQAAGDVIKISINLSAMDLLNEELPEILTGTLATAGLPASLLGLEITESAVMRDPRTALAVLGRLRDAGFVLSIDDFGTGYSSLAQLKRLPVSELKIDKSFVLELSADSEDATIVRSTIDLAHSMGLTVVAEGVETAAGWALLRDYGCDVAQGYLISKPLPAHAFLQWLHERAGNFNVEAA